MGTDITANSSALAVFDAPLVTIASGLAIGNKLRTKHAYSNALRCGLSHHSGSVHEAIMVRNELLSDFLEADSAAMTLWRQARLERPLAIKMIGTLYRSLGIKPGPELEGMLEGCLAMIESDGLGQASGLWQPLHVTPAILAIACRKMINTAIYPPKPAELRAACEEAGNNLRFAHTAADDVVHQVRKADAILLAFDHDEWKRAYESPRSRPALVKMLWLHECFGDGEERADECEPTAFEQLVERERTKLAIEQTPPKKIAAARRRPQQKRSAKLKSESEGERT